MATLETLLTNPPKVHEWEPGEITASGLPVETFRFMDGFLNSEHRTLETGMGISTALFLMKGCDHVCINPEPEEYNRLIEYCKANGISDDKFTFVPNRSDLAMFDDKLDGEFDLLLIDGGHGFPIPMLDYHYYAAKVKKGGLLMIDDTHLWSVKILIDFIEGNGDWKRVEDLPVKTAVFERLNSETLTKEWCFQKYVIEQTDLLQSDAKSEVAQPSLVEKIKALFG